MRQTRLICALAFALASIADYPKHVQAQLTEPNNNVSESEQLTAFQQPPPPDDAPDGRRRGTGSRTEYSSNSGRRGNITLTPLIPSDSWGYTISESPIIWVYIQHSSGKSTEKIQGRFSLQDPTKNKELLPNISVTLPQESGIFGIRLPHSYSLPSGKMYRWYLALDDCEDDCEIFVDGWVRRQVENSENRELQRQLAQAKTAQERYILYSQAGIWYDAMNEAAQIRCNNLQNHSLNDPLAIALKAVELEDIAQTPLICM